MANDLETRIRERAHRMWLDEGRPESRAESHWELAKTAMATEDARPQMLKPIENSISEPVEAWTNQGEFPQLTDQGEQNAPGQTTDPDG
jgi:Protein of unknown function (DUF2934)